MAATRHANDDVVSVQQSRSAASSFGPPAGTMLNLDVDGVSIAVTTAGAGAPMVLLHCSGSSAAQWRDLGAILARDFHIAAPDSYGCGSTGAWPGRRPIRLADHAHMVAEVVRAHGYPVHLVGHSFGGAVALRLALDFPELLRSLVLIEPVSFQLLRGGEPADGRPVCGDPQPRVRGFRVRPQQRRARGHGAFRRLLERAVRLVASVTRGAGAAGRPDRRRRCELHRDVWRSDATGGLPPHRCPDARAARQCLAAAVPPAGRNGRRDDSGGRRSHDRRRRPYGAPDACGGGGRPGHGFHGAGTPTRRQRRVDQIDVCEPECPCGNSGLSVYTFSRNFNAVETASDGGADRHRIEVYRTNRSYRRNRRSPICGANCKPPTTGWRSCGTSSATPHRSRSASSRSSPVGGIRPRRG